MKRIFVVLISFVFSLKTLAQGQGDKSLAVGDLVPTLIVDKWIKGDSISTFESGKIYIVEIGSVGCSPCRAAIPHLSRLAKKYENIVSVVSVFMEDEISRVQNFVVGMGEKISYNVTFDGPEYTMNENWMKPAGQNGIPISFVVENGVLKWIGYPTDVDPIIEEILEGTFNPEKAVEQQMEINQLFTNINEALKASDFCLALNQLNQLISKCPYNLFLLVQKFGIMLKYKEEEAYSFARNLLEGKLSDDEAPLYYLARSITEEKLNLKSPDWELVKLLTNRAYYLCQDDRISIGILVEKSRAQYYSGNPDEAIETIEYAKKLCGRLSIDKSESYKKYLNRILTEYGR